MNTENFKFEENVVKKSESIYKYMKSDVNILLSNYLLNPIDFPSYQSICKFLKKFLFLGYSQDFEESKKEFLEGYSIVTTIYFGFLILSSSKAILEYFIMKKKFESFTSHHLRHSIVFFMFNIAFGVWRLFLWAIRDAIYFHVGEENSITYFLRCFVTCLSIHLVLTPFFKSSYNYEKMKAYLLMTFFFIEYMNTPTIGADDNFSGIRGHLLVYFKLTLLFSIIFVYILEYLFENNLHTYKFDFLPNTTLISQEKKEILFKNLSKLGTKKEETFIGLLDFESIKIVPHLKENYVLIPSKFLDLNFNLMQYHIISKIIFSQNRHSRIHLILDLIPSLYTFILSMLNFVQLRIRVVMFMGLYISLFLYLYAVLRNNIMFRLAWARHIALCKVFPNLIDSILTENNVKVCDRNKFFKNVIYEQLTCNEHNLIRSSKAFFTILRNLLSWK